MTLITVGIPFVNEEAHLAAAVKSVLRQTYAELEVLLVDDGSTDRSVAIARSFDDPRVRVIADGRGRYLASRLNQIVDAARGKYVARMDADDVIHPKRFARQLALLEEGGFDAVGSWAGMVDDGETPFGVVEAAAPGVSPRHVLESGVLPHPTLLAPREWFLANRYDERLTRTEDRDLWCRTAATTRFGVVREPLYVLRIEAREAAFLPTYVETQRQNRALFLRYGPDMIGWPATAAAWTRSHAKSAAMRTAARLGLASRLVHRRGRPPTAAERALIVEALSL